MPEQLFSLSHAGLPAFNAGCHITLVFPVIFLRNHEHSENNVLRPIFHDLRSRLPQLSVLLCCSFLTAYFAYHTVYGRHGFEARTKLMERSQLLDFEIRSLEAVRSKLSQDVALLAPDRPDPDIVDEVARDVLGFARPDDHILLP